MKHLEKLAKANALPLEPGVKILLYWPKEEPVPANWKAACPTLGPSHGFWSILIERVE